MALTFLLIWGILENNVAKLISNIASFYFDFQLIY